MEHSDKRHHAVHIPPEHQSAPKETDADKAVKRAAQEIHEGQWRPSDEALGEIEGLPSIALRAGDAAALGAPLTRGDFDRTDESLVLSEHPAVQEALAKLEQEKRASKSGQEYIEKAAMIHELLENQKRGQRWDGQERWDRENEEARHGKILTPLQFYDQLMRFGFNIDAPLSTTHDYPVRQSDWVPDVEMVDGRPQMTRTLKASTYHVRTIGRGPVLLARDAKKVHAEDRSGRAALLTLEHIKGAGIVGMDEAEHDEPKQVACLQWPFSTEWMVYKFDEFGVPRTPKYLGWRTALLTLIRVGLISEAQAHKAFPLGTGPQSSWYRQQLFEWSNGGGRVQ